MGRGGDGAVVVCPLSIIGHGIPGDEMVQFLVRESLVYRFLNGRDNGVFGQAASTRTYLNAKPIKEKPQFGKPANKGKKDSEDKNG